MSALGLGLGVDLLHLVDDQEQPSRWAHVAQDRGNPGYRIRHPTQGDSEGVVRCGARAERPDDPVPAVAFRQPWQQAGEDERRLARTGGPDDEQRGLVPQPSDEFEDFLLSSEEQVRTVGVERHHPWVRAGQLLGPRRGLIEQGPDAGQLGLPASRIGAGEVEPHAEVDVERNVQVRTWMGTTRGQPSLIPEWDASCSPNTDHTSARKAGLRTRRTRRLSLTARSNSAATGAPSRKSWA